MPRNGRSAAIQSRIGSTKPAARSRSIAGAAAPDAGHDEQVRAVDAHPVGGDAARRAPAA